MTLDVLLAVLQLATLILAFGATVPSDLDATTDAEGSRDYSSLLGIDQDDAAEGGHTDDQDDILFDGGEWIGTSSRTRAGYEPVNIRGSDPLDPYGDPSRNQGELFPQSVQIVFGQADACSPYQAHQANITRRQDPLLSA